MTEITFFEVKRCINSGEVLQLLSTLTFHRNSTDMSVGMLINNQRTDKLMQFFYSVGLNWGFSQLK
jgi:hypothetical protein